MPISKPTSHERPDRGLPLSQAALRDDLQWLAIAWAVRNWMELAAIESPALADAISRNSGPDNSSLGSPSLGNHWPGKLPEPDPTQGATHFHRHDEQPQWAAAHQPIALIGDFLFYKLTRSL